ncbi:hypothetical protein C8D88_101912 [Lentzea atacamensis]|uniref:Peptidase inhibitor family I36 n=1 Tax=Lentzea atacamensis TaxID=531938 RepID=A0A316IBH1_9PSEU|nr:hypothetical protein [Lentzea atacamensis]PWK90887.1 hypothetical protein C8D88_101912 [Lentzea atacamensis]RAS60437.1 hypothetical protein C8D87_112339 [Lentzea atacamensis]
MNTRKILAGVLAAGAMALAAPAGAQAAVPDDPYGFCWPSASDCANGTSGTIVWSNRTATATGTIWHYSGSGSSQAQFRAFAGDKQIGKLDTRTVHAGGADEGYSVGLGDTDLRGGINRVDIRFCSPTLTNCSVWAHFYK